MDARLYLQSLSKREHKKNENNLLPVLSPGPSVYNLSLLFSCLNLFRNAPFQTFWDGGCVTVAVIGMPHILGVTSLRESGRRSLELLTRLHAASSRDSRLRR